MTSKRIRSRGLALAVAGGLATSLAISAAEAAGHVEVVVEFDASNGEFPEGVAVDKKGNVFASLSARGELVKIPAGDSAAESFGAVPGIVAGDIGLIGLAVDAPGNVYGAVFSPIGGGSGVWKFDRRTGAEELVAGTDAMFFPNSVAFDKRGNMYVTDTVLGQVWRVPPGGVAELWAEDPLLLGDMSAGFPFPIGANGIAVRQDTVYVGVTETASIVTIPINGDGSAGTAEVLAVVPGRPVDGIALDVHGAVYYASPLPTPAIVKVSPDGTSEVVADDPLILDGPTSVAFGTGRGDKQSIFVANFSEGLGPGAGTGAGPSIAKVDVGEPGQPVP